MIFDKLKALLANYAGTEVLAPIAYGAKGSVVSEQCFFNCDCDYSTSDCWDDYDDDDSEPDCSDDTE